MTKQAIVRMPRRADGVENPIKSKHFSEGPAHQQYGEEMVPLATNMWKHNSCATVKKIAHLMTMNLDGTFNCRNDNDTGSKAK